MALDEFDIARGAIVQEYLKPFLPLLNSGEPINNIWVFGDGRVFYEVRGAKLLWDQKIDMTYDDLQYMLTIQNDSDIPFGKKNPFLVATIPPKSRLFAIHESLNKEGGFLTIRLFPERLSFNDLVGRDGVTAEAIPFLDEIINTAASFLMVGAPGAGKTTLLNAMFDLYKSNNLEFVYIAQDVDEINIDLPMVSNNIMANLFLKDSSSTLTLSSLIKGAMRSTPDRVIVGEVIEGTAARAFFEVLNTGIAGVCTTIHANNAMAAIDRLISLLQEVDTHTPRQVLDEQIRSYIGFLLFCVRDRETGKRYLREIWDLREGGKCVFKRDLGEYAQSQ